MNKQTEALKLARDALEHISSHYMSLPKIGCMALAAVDEALAEQPAQPSKPLTDEQITAGARALCKRMAEACGVDVRDQWQLYSDTFKEDAKAVLEAAHGIKGDA